MSKASDIRAKKFASNEKILLDTNIWLVLQGPQGKPDRRTKIYSQALADMLAAGCQIVVDALVISEFVNRFARIHFELVKQPNETFKTFRNSAAFKPIASAIAAEVREIFYISRRIDSGFSALNDTDLLNQFAVGGSDFNDLVIADICRCNNYTLVTHDGDFATSGLSVLTANNKLLQA